MKFEKEVFPMKFYYNSNFVGVGINGQGLDDILPREKIAPVMFPWHGEPLPENWSKSVTWIQLFVSTDGKQREMTSYCIKEYDAEPENPGAAQFLVR